MKEYYYEITIKPSDFLEEFESFLMDRFFNGIEERDGSLILRSEEPMRELLDQTRGYAKALEELFDKRITLDIEVKRLKNRDWVESYKKSITPVDTGIFYIRPSWYEPREGRIDIVIDPAFAFGSGHHASTFNCLRILQRMDLEGKEVLDVGCGSGILAVAAAKKGAICSLCDTDAEAIRESEKNFRLNEVEFKKRWVGSVSNLKEKYDIVIANIVADVLIFLSKELKEAVKEGGFLLLSGIVRKQKSKVAKSFKELKLVQEIDQEEWVTLLFKKE